MTTAQAQDAKAQGKLGVFFDIEGMNALGGQADLVRLYYDLDVRWMLVAYNRASSAGGGCLDEADQGLTAVGRTAIVQRNRVGMVLCCTHAGYKTGCQAIVASAYPEIFPRGAVGRSATLEPWRLPEITRALENRIADQVWRPQTSQGKYHAR